MSTSGTPKTAALTTDVAFHDDLLEFTLAGGRVVGVPIQWFPRLHDASLARLQNSRLIGGCVGVHWADLDEDISVKNRLAVQARRHRK